MQPRDTCRLSVYALKKEYGLSDSEFERTDDEVEEEKDHKDKTSSKNKPRRKMKVSQKLKDHRQ
eukprot:10772267-Ditylum_brightwellii.AAC.1